MQSNFTRRGAGDLGHTMAPQSARSGAGDEEGDARSSEADTLSAWGDERLGSGSDLSDWSGSGSGCASPHRAHLTNGTPTPTR